VVGGPAAGNPDPPIAHAAAVCADYPNQAAAQRAADTRDADGDGIYCESLPCPCLKPGTSGTTGASPSPSTRPGPKPKLGPSVPLARRSKRSGCKVDGPLPDTACTPGARFKYATKAKMCRPGYSKSVRNVPQATKNAVYRAYGMTAHFNGQTGEVDHLVSLELGGSNSIANLFPEAATPTPGSHQKDRLENQLHDEVCAGRITLTHAQHLIAANWVAAYHARFG
jgi:hypothetical protein